MSLPRFLIGLLLGVFAFLAVRALDAGVALGWPHWLRGLAAATVAALIVGAVICVMNGLGVLTTSTLQQSYPPDTPPNRRISLLHFLLVYLGLLGLGVGLAIGLQILNVPMERTIFCFAGATFLLASTRTPWWLFDSMRRVGWFADVPSDRVMQGLLFLLGAASILAGVAL